jgi:hypothetical protein
VLIAHDGQAGGVEMIVVLVLLLLAGAVSLLGPDPRDYDDRDRRGWWPGHR